MKKLTDILKNTPVREVRGDTAAAIGGLVYDSRAVKPGDCFFAVPGDAERRPRLYPHGG